MVKKQKFFPLPISFFLFLIILGFVIFFISGKYADVRNKYEIGNQVIKSQELEQLFIEYALECNDPNIVKIVALALYKERLYERMRDVNDFNDLLEISRIIKNSVPKP